MTDAGYEKSGMFGEHFSMGSAMPPSLELGLSIP